MILTYALNLSVIYDRKTFIVQATDVNGSRIQTHQLRIMSKFSTIALPASTLKVKIWPLKSEV
jgi:hypothetical protein